MVCTLDIRYQGILNIQRPIAHASCHCSTTFSICPTTSSSFVQSCPKTSQPSLLDTPGQRMFCKGENLLWNISMIRFATPITSLATFSLVQTSCVPWNSGRFSDKHEQLLRRHLVADLLGHGGAHLFYHRAALFCYYLHNTNLILICELWKVLLDKPYNTCPPLI